MKSASLPSKSNTEQASPPSLAASKGQSQDPPSYGIATAEAIDEISPEADKEETGAMKITPALQLSLGDGTEKTEVGQRSAPAYGLGFVDHPSQPIQRMEDGGQQTHSDTAFQANPIPNNTGLPDQLKTGIESLSGYSMDDVKVHYNSSKPAQVNALAYAQGTDIHLGPGQERHLPHEAWHVVQQKQGRVRPTMHLRSLMINDNNALEHEANNLGALAENISKNHTKRIKFKNKPFTSAPTSKLSLKGSDSSNGVIQRIKFREIKKESLKLQEVISEINTTITGTNELHHWVNYFQNLDVDDGNSFKPAIDRILGVIGGEALELRYWRSKIDKGRSAIFGSFIEGGTTYGADITAIRKDGTNRKSLQFKSVSVVKDSRVVEVLGHAAKQLRGDHGELPPTDAQRVINVLIRNPKNLFPYTASDASRGDKIETKSGVDVLNRFKTRLEGIPNVWQNDAVDKVKVVYHNPRKSGDNQLIKTLVVKVVGGIRSAKNLKDEGLETSGSTSTRSWVPFAARKRAAVQ